MSTTSLTTYASGYAVGRQQVNFDVRSSTPGSGAVTDGWGEWYVIRGGAILTSATVLKTLDFAWCGLDGDIVKVRYVGPGDTQAEAGDWEEYTYSVAANTAADIVRYVDTGGDNGDDGSIGSPWATIAYAKSYMASNLTSGQVGVIILADDQTHTVTSTRIWDGGNTTPRLVRFVRSGDGTDRPLISMVNEHMCALGRRESVHLDGLSLTSNAVWVRLADLSRNGAGTRSPFNFMMVDCDSSNFGDGVYGNDDTSGSTERDAGDNDFVAVQDCDMGLNHEYQFWGLAFARRICIRNVSMAKSTDNPTLKLFRVNNWESFFIHDLRNAVESGFGLSASLRFGQRDGTLSEAVRYGSLSKIQHIGSADGISGITISMNAVAPDGVTFAHDIRVVNSFMPDCAIRIERNISGFKNMVDLDRLQVWDSVLDRINVSAEDDAATTSASIKGVDVRNNAFAISSAEGANGLVLLGPSSKFSGTINFTGNIAYHAGAGTGTFDSLRLLLTAEGFTRAALVAVIGEMDNNQQGKVDAIGEVKWANFSDTPFNSTLSGWQGATAFDDASSTNSTTTMDFVDPGTTAAEDRDARMSAGTGPQAGTGWPVPYWPDADGFLRHATTPDAGPYEYGASATPDDPEVEVPPDPEPTPTPPPVGPPGRRELLGVPSRPTSIVKRMMAKVAPPSPKRGKGIRDRVMGKPAAKPKPSAALRSRIMRGPPKRR